MKLFYVKSVHKNLTNDANREIIWEGTLEYLKERVFSYTLEYGHFQNDKISTIKSLVTALNKSAGVCRGYGFYYKISSKEEFDNASEDNKHVMD